MAVVGADACQRPSIHRRGRGRAAAGLHCRLQRRRIRENRVMYSCRCAQPLASCAPYSGLHNGFSPTLVGSGGGDHGRSLPCGQRLRCGSRLGQVIYQRRIAGCSPASPVFRSSAAALIFLYGDDFSGVAARGLQRGCATLPAPYSRRREGKRLRLGTVREWAFFSCLIVACASHLARASRFADSRCAPVPCQMAGCGCVTASKKSPAGQRRLAKASGNNNRWEAAEHGKKIQPV